MGTTLYSQCYYYHTAFNISKKKGIDKVMSISNEVRKAICITEVKNYEYCIKITINTINTSNLY